MSEKLTLNKSSKSNQGKTNNNDRKIERLEREVREAKSKRPVPYSLVEKGTKLIYQLRNQSHGLNFTDNDTCTVNFHKLSCLLPTFKRVAAVTKAVTLNPTTLNSRADKKVVDSEGRETKEVMTNANGKPMSKANHKDKLELICEVASRDPRSLAAVEELANCLEAINEHAREIDFFDAYVNATKAEKDRLMQTITEAMVSHEYTSDSD